MQQSPARRLQSPPARLPEDPQLQAESNEVVILAAMICALICLIGLALVALCAWLRRRSAAQSTPPPPRKGLKKKALLSLPKLSFDASAGGGRLAECPICLAEFAEGDEIRILPECGHGFHVDCIDTWLRARSSCPSCRHVLVVVAPPSRCRACETSRCESSSAAGAAAGVGADTLLP